MTIDRYTLRTIVRGTYDLQTFRIETGNRLGQNFRHKLGLDQDPDDEDAGKVLAELETRYKRITDGIATVTRRRTFDYDGVISNYVELCLVKQYFDLLAQEERAFRDMRYAVEAFPIWEAFLKDVRGVGPAMAGVIISEIDPHRAKYASSIWRYAGLDVAKDGRGRSRKEEHLIEVEYEAKDGTTKTRRSITFNPFLKTKLVGVLGPSFLRASGAYRDVYDAYKHRIEHSPRHADKTKLHRHNMAIRYMVKRFLADLYEAWRPLKGLPVHDPYHEAKLGITHGAE